MAQGGYQGREVILFSVVACAIKLYFHPLPLRE